MTAESKKLYFNHEKKHKNMTIINDIDVSRIKSLVEQGRIKAALEWMPSNDIEVISLKQQIARADKDFNNYAISDDNYDLVISRTAKAILEIVAELEIVDYTIPLNDIPNLCAYCKHRMLRHLELSKQLMLPKRENT